MVARSTCRSHLRQLPNRTQLLCFHQCLENTFASATIELAENQSVVSTGMYGVVRHPMYSGALLLMLGIPLALGSLWSALLIVVAVAILNWRIIDEEKFLLTHLNGYQEYCNKVKYRLIPGLY
jgi:protein-S-isoprenylcysteine O-methyltransferase Ste14